MLRTLISVLAIAAGGLAACSPTTEGAPGAQAASRQCFFTSTVNSFREGTERDNVIVRVGTRTEYELAPTGVCRDISWARGITLVPALGEGGSLCIGDLADVQTMGGSAIPERCQVRVVRKVEPTPPDTDAG